MDTWKKHRWRKIKLFSPVCAGQIGYVIKKRDDDDFETLLLKNGDEIRISIYDTDWHNSKSKGREGLADWKRERFHYMLRRNRLKHDLNFLENNPNLKVIRRLEPDAEYSKQCFFEKCLELEKQIDKYQRLMDNIDNDIEDYHDEMKILELFQLYKLSYKKADWEKAVNTEYKTGKQLILL